MARPKYGSTKEQGRVVKKILKWRMPGLDSLLPREIADELNKKGIPAPSPGPWSPSAVNRVLTTYQDELLDMEAKALAKRQADSPPIDIYAQMKAADEEELKRMGGILYTSYYRDSEGETHEKQELWEPWMKEQADERRAAQLLIKNARLGSLQFHSWIKCEPWEAKNGPVGAVPPHKKLNGIPELTTRADGKHIHALLDNLRTGKELRQSEKRELRIAVNGLLDLIAWQRHGLLATQQQIEEEVLRRLAAQQKINEETEAQQ